jgi:hypothetical protein
MVGLLSLFFPPHQSVGKLVTGEQAATAFLTELHTLLGVVGIEPTTSTVFAVALSRK